MRRSTMHQEAQLRRDVRWRNVGAVTKCGASENVRKIKRNDGPVQLPVRTYFDRSRPRHHATSRRLCLAYTRAIPDTDVLAASLPIRQARCDKLAAIVGDLNDVSQRLQAASDSHSEAMKKLATGRGNALSRAQKLKSLGVTSKKELPGVTIGADKHLVDGDDDDVLSSPVEPVTPKLLDKPTSGA